MTHRTSQLVLLLAFVALLGTCTWHGSNRTSDEDTKKKAVRHR